jgi:hypothetical protein
MPVFHLGDLVRPNPITWQDDDNPDALGIILEMRSGVLTPTAKILWNDMPVPEWNTLRDVVLAEETP